MPKKRPATVENFLNYVNSGFYANTIFHRVIDNFMIQGGGFEPGMKQKDAGATIKNEADNGLKNDAYTIAMARTPDPHSASSQFFINVADNEFLGFPRADRERVRLLRLRPGGGGKRGGGPNQKSEDRQRGMHHDVPLDDVVISKAEVIEKQKDRGLGCGPQRPRIAHSARPIPQNPAVRFTALHLRSSPDRRAARDQPHLLRFRAGYGAPGRCALHPGRFVRTLDRRR